MMRTGADEAACPKYAHIERERRWLVATDKRLDLAALSFTLIEDRYITGSRMRLRRMTDSRSSLQSLKLTKKYEVADPVARPIVTIYLTDAEFALLEILPARPITKRRYHLVDRDLTFSLDQFLGPLSGLELVEIEWPNDTELRALQPPIWAVRDVSDDPRYEGGSLSTHGRPKE